MSFQFYQRMGIYPWAHKRVIPAITEISRAVGAPGVAMSCFQPTGIGLHKTGEACDFQAGNAVKYGSKYRDAKAVHNEIAKYVLANWDRLNVRYMAWDKYEYGGAWGGPERKRKQPYYGGSDPWHEHHVHVDFKPGAISGARPDIRIGAGIAGSVGSGVDLKSKHYYTGKIDSKQGTMFYGALQRFLRDRGYYPASKYVIDGIAGSATWTEFQKFLKDLGYFGPKPSGVQDMTTARAVQQWQTNTGHYKGKITATWTSATWECLQRYLSYAHKGTKVYKRKVSSPAPKPSPKPSPKPAPKPEPKKGFPMALTDAEQKQLLKDNKEFRNDNRKMKTAIQRNEERLSDTLDLLAQLAEAQAEVVEALTSREHSSKLLDKIFKTNAAVGRAERIRLEEEIRSAEAETESQDDEMIIEEEGEVLETKVEEEGKE